MAPPTDVDLPFRRGDLLAPNGVDRGSASCLEITESAVISDPAQDRSLPSDRLAGMGVRFPVDDFGMGYSSLTYLTR